MMESSGAHAWGGDLRDAGERGGRHRVACLMCRTGLQNIGENPV